MKKLKKDTFNIIGTGIGLGVGSEALGDAGSTQGQAAIGKISGKLPTLGSLAGTGAVMRGLKKLNKKAKY